MVKHPNWGPMCLRPTPDWGPVCLRPTPDCTDSIFHWSHGLTGVPICEEDIEKGLAFHCLKLTKITDPRPELYMEKNESNLHAMAHLLLELIKKGQFAVWHGMESVPRIHDANTAWHIILCIQSMEYSSFDVIIPIGNDYDRSHIVWIRVHIEWICQKSVESFVGGFKISYYRDSPRFGDPLQYIPYNSMKLPQLKNVISSEDGAHLLQDLALSPVYAMGDKRLAATLIEFINRNLCSSICWGGDGIMVSGCSDVYRKNVADYLTSILYRMPRGVRNILQFYIWCDICIHVECVKINPHTNPVYKITYLSAPRRRTGEAVNSSASSSASSAAL